MALQLEKEHKGITANYWRINQLLIDDTQDVAQVHLWLYANETAKDQDLANALERKVITITSVSKIEIPEALQSITNTRDLLKAMLYTVIKTSVLDEEGVEQNEFAAATDV